MSDAQSNVSEIKTIVTDIKNDLTRFENTEEEVRDAVGRLSIMRGQLCDQMLELLAIEKDPDLTHEEIGSRIKEVREQLCAQMLELVTLETNMLEFFLPNEPVEAAPIMTTRASP